MNTGKNSTLELLKLFASYMVVFIHILFYGKLGVTVDALARFAVPFFFLVSGYYSYQITTLKIKKRIKNILILFAFSAVCCTAFEIIRLLKYNTDGLVTLINKFTKVSTYVDLIVFNVPVSSGHLWYLLAVLYVYIIFYFITKFQIEEKIIFTVSLLLLLLHIFLGEGLSIFGTTLPMHFVRNFALMGIPFFSLGLFVKKHEEKLRGVPNYLIYLLLIIGAFESVFSRFFFDANELYVGSIFILIALVCVFIKGANVKYPAFLTALEGCSTYIYVSHIAIATVITIIFSIVGIDIYSSTTLENLYPIAVCFASTIFAYVLIKILKRKRTHQ